MSPRAAWRHIWNKLEPESSVPFEFSDPIFFAICSWLLHCMASLQLVVSHVLCVKVS